MFEVCIVVFTLFYLKFVNKQPWGNLHTLYCNDCTTMNSMTWFDRYSTVHFYVGALWYFALKLTNWSAKMRHLAMICAICVYEMGENTQGWQTTWHDPSYLGDALINSFTDIIVAIAGYMLANCVGFIPMLLLCVVFHILHMFPMNVHINNPKGI